MEIGSVQGLMMSRLDALTQQRNVVVEEEKPALSFDSFLQAMLSNLNATNDAIRTSQEFQLDVAQGYSDDLIGLTLAIDRANSALNFTVQVTNRLLEAYREIMRMQV